MDAVKDSPDRRLDPGEYLPQCEAAARSAGLKIARFGEVAGFPLLGLTRRTAGPRPRIYLSAGIHGDEPAPPLALVRLMAEGFFADRATWFICPVLNPTGFVAGRRENFQGIDLNRDYQDLRAGEVQAHVAWLNRQPNFDLAICLHEDWEATGFYLYELNPELRPTLAYAMIDAARLEGPIEPATTIDDRKVTEPGIIRPVSDPLLRENWPEAVYLRSQHSTLLYTIETSSAGPLERRIATHCAVLRAAVGKLLG